MPAASLDHAPSREYSASYVAANDELNRIAFRIARLLESKGYRAVPISSSSPYDLRTMFGDMSHRHAGELAGIGVFGKNSLLLSPEFGPRIRLVSVVTDARLPSSKPLRSDLCGNCTRCLQACPAKALKPGMVVDKEKCDVHHVRIGELLQLKDWEQVCGVCIRVCPVGRSEMKRRRN